MFGKRRESKSPDQKVRIEQSFRFESVKTRIAPGTWFVALNDAIDRWVVTLNASYDFLGKSFRILYQLKDDRYLMLQYECCQLNSASQIWESTEPPRGRGIEPFEAAHFLMQSGFDVPDQLADAWDLWEQKQREPKEPEVRPFSFWVEKTPVFMKTGILSHELDLVSNSDEVAHYLAILIRSLNDWGGEGRHLTNEELGMKYKLFGQYKVDPNRWRSKWDDPPPEYLNVIDLDWPSELLNIRDIYSQLQNLLLEPLSCLPHYRMLTSDQNPTEEEMKRAWEDLVTKKDNLQSLYIDLNSEIRKLKEAIAIKELEEAQIESRSVDQVSENIDSELLTSGAETCGEVTSLSTSHTTFANDESKIETLSEQPEDPILEFLPGGYRFNGRDFSLSGKPYALFELIANSKHRTLTRQEALDEVWNGIAVQDNTVNQTISTIRGSLRKCLCLTDKVDPIPALDRGENAAWRLEFKFQLKNG
ncbi:winged helix-turn-helix domain-containing protein [Thalassoglobus sp.]|uniref:winged helix-turn-helix domain-containing protein n=1 Tax=Thalassoglobus sp. TaxID=2795869 RepID=UPI003AA8FB45